MWMEDKSRMLGGEGGFLINGKGAKDTISDLDAQWPLRISLFMFLKINTVHSQVA